MFKKTGFALFCASAVFSINAPASNAPASTTQAFAPQTSYDYILVPNIPKRFTNYFFHKITATCVIETEDPVDYIEILGINLSGKVNGESVTKGTHISRPVTNGFNLVIEAESAAVVDLTNLGEHNVTAKCHL